MKNDPIAPAIRLQDVHVSLRSRAGLVDILTGVGLSVRQGEAVAVVGPSGSGKSTLLMVVAGLETATAGKVEIMGRDLTPLDEDERALLRAGNIGIVFQSFHLVPTMTALENVALPLEFLGEADPFETAYEALAAVGLAPRADHFPAQLSGGEQQRVAIARALAPGPNILLADEPTGNLDSRTGEHVMDILFDLRARSDATLLLITHDPALTKRCARVLTMRDGALVEGGSRPARAAERAAQ